MNVAVGKASVDGDFTSFIDEDSLAQEDAGAWRDEGIQVHHRPVVFPQEGVGLMVAVGQRIAHHLALGIPAECHTALISIEATEVRHAAVFPPKSTEQLIVIRKRTTDDPSGLIVTNWLKIPGGALATRN